MYNPFSLEGKTVLVTGASSGIGRGIAIECSKMGAKVVINGRNKERLQKTFDQLEGEGHIQIVADLSIQEDIERLANEVPELNGFVNSAGIPKICPVKRIDRQNECECFWTDTLDLTASSQKEVAKEVFYRIDCIHFRCLYGKYRRRALCCNQGCTCRLHQDRCI